jgi:hypothetical protein
MLGCMVGEVSPYHRLLDKVDIALVTSHTLYITTKMFFFLILTVSIVVELNILCWE